MIKLSKRGEAKAEILEGASEYGYKVGKIILYLGNFFFFLIYLLEFLKQKTREW